MATYSNASSKLYKRVEWQTPPVGSPSTIITCPANRIIKIYENRLRVDSGFNSNPQVTINTVGVGVSSQRYQSNLNSFANQTFVNEEDFETNASDILIMFPGDTLVITAIGSSDTNQYTTYYLEEGT